MKQTEVARNILLKIRSEKVQFLNVIKRVSENVFEKDKNKNVAVLELETTESFRFVDRHISLVAHLSLNKVCFNHLKNHKPTLSGKLNGEITLSWLFPAEKRIFDRYKLFPRTHFRIVCE